MAAFMAESWLWANTQDLAKSLAQQLGSKEYSLIEQMNAQKNSASWKSKFKHRLTNIILAHKKYKDEHSSYTVSQRHKTEYGKTRETRAAGDTTVWKQVEDSRDGREGNPAKQAQE